MIRASSSASRALQGGNHGEETREMSVTGMTVSAGSRVGSRAATARRTRGPIGDCNSCSVSCGDRERK